MKNHQRIDGIKTSYFAAGKLLMPIITLTTDLGTRDHYAGSVKGALISAIPDATIIDITHDIEPFNTLHAAHVLRNCYRDFPVGTIHLIGVNAFHDAVTATLVVQHQGCWFVAPDNGFFGLIWEEESPSSIFLLKEYESIFPMRDEFVRAASHIISGTVEQIAVKATTYRMSRMTKPLISEQYLRGSIVYFDRFGNAITNIQKKDFNAMVKGRNFTVAFKRYADVESLSLNYASVDESEKMCFFNSSGYLEIAINKGNARQLLNLNYSDTVQIDFH